MYLGTIGGVRVLQGKKNIRETNRKSLFRWWVYAGAKNAVNGMFMHEEYSSYARQHSKIVGLSGRSRSASDCCEMFHGLLPSQGKNVWRIWKGQELTSR